LHFHSEMPLRCAVTSGDWCCLAACTQLVHLHCCNNPMRGFLRLPPLPHLRSVDVSGSDVSGCDGLAACPLLERVVLFHTQMAALMERNHNPPASAPAGASSEDDLGTAWGITDPRTLAALKKREAKFKGKDAARRQKEVSMRRCGSRFFESAFLRYDTASRRPCLPPTGAWSFSGLKPAAQGRRRHRRGRDWPRGRVTLPTRLGGRAWG
jgi:hypothetical protein